jgi:ankyrin repeat protein
VLGETMKPKHSGQMELLHFAARDGELDLVRSVLDAGSDVNEPAENSWTPLHFAAEGGHVFVVQFLLDRGADPSAMTSEGYTPLDVAAVYDRSGIVELLQRYGTPKRRRR